MKDRNPKDQQYKKKGRLRKESNSEIGNQLRLLRVSQGWTLVQAGKESGISHRIIAKLEKGGSNTSIKHLEDYLDFYGLRLSTKPLEDIRPKESDNEKIDLDEKGLPKW